MRAMERSTQVKKAILMSLVLFVAGGVFAATPAVPAPAKPAVTAPAKPAVTIPAKPAVTVPAKPVVAVPEKPAVAVPGKAEVAGKAAEAAGSAASAASTASASTTQMAAAAVADSATKLAAAAAAVQPSSTVVAASVPVRIGPTKDEYKEFKIPIDPIYAFNWTEAFALPSVGDWFLGANFASSFGGKYTINQEHALFGIYNLLYRGPGLKTQEGREFAERSMDNNIMLEHQWMVMPGYKVRTRGLFMNELRRTGTNEVWGKGLYDFRVFGGGVVQDFNVRQVTDLSFEVTYQYFSFPNYTDLLQEFQSASLKSELSGGQQDYNNIRLHLDGKFLEIGSAFLGWNMQSYVNAKVVGINKEYTDKKQLDNNIELGTEWDVQLLAANPTTKEGRLSTTPALKANFKRSNQNYWYYRYFGDTNPVWRPTYYDYNSVDLSSPIRWVYSVAESGGASSLFFSPSWVYTGYTKRPPRDEKGVYIEGKKQATTILVLTPGITMATSRFSSMTWGYSYQVQASNNKFEKFLPSNYNGHSVFMSYDIKF